MAVEEVHVGPRKTEIDPKSQKPKDPNDPGYWDQKKAEERARREFLEEKKMIDDLNNPPSAPPAPFQVKGEVDLGKINIQEQTQKAEAAAAAERVASKERENKLTEELRKTTEELHNVQLQRVSSELSAKIESLQQAIAGGNKKTVTEQLAEVSGLAEQLGYVKPQVGGTNGDPHILLEIKKLEMQMAHDDREFQRQMKKDEREWDLRIEEIKQQRLDTQAKLEVEREKQKMWNAAPERIGAVIAKGLTSQPPGPERVSGAAAGKGPGKPILVTADKDEVGELDCPNCKTVVAIGKTARSAVCAQCGQKFTIKRVTSEPSPTSEIPPEEE